MLRTVVMADFNALSRHYTREICKHTEHKLCNSFSSTCVVCTTSYSSRSLSMYCSTGLYSNQRITFDVFPACLVLEAFIAISELRYKQSQHAQFYRPSQQLASYSRCTFSMHSSAALHSNQRVTLDLLPACKFVISIRFRQNWKVPTNLI